MNVLSETEKAYIAASFDGEGHIGVAKYGKIRQNSGPDYRASCYVVNTNKKFVDWMFETTGVGIVEQVSKGTSKSKPTWSWRLRVENNEIRDVLQSLLLYLVIKDGQALLMLDFLTYTNPSRQPVDDWKITQGREFCFQELAKLNKRGPSGTKPDLP